MKQYHYKVRQMVNPRIDKRIQKRQRIMLPENTTSIDLCYDEDGLLEFIDIDYRKKEPFEV